MMDKPNWDHRFVGVTTAKVIDEIITNINEICARQNDGFQIIKEWENFGKRLSALEKWCKETEPNLKYVFRSIHNLPHPAPSIVEVTPEELVPKQPDTPADELCPECGDTGFVETPNGLRQCECCTIAPADDMAPENISESEHEWNQYVKTKAALKKSEEQLETSRIINNGIRKANRIVHEQRRKAEATLDAVREYAVRVSQIVYEGTLRGKTITPTQIVDHITGLIDAQGEKD